MAGCVRNVLGYQNGEDDPALADTMAGLRLVPHQANMRIMEAARERTGVSKDKLYVVLHKYGNMSAATIPVALHDARTEGRIKDGDILVMTAFGTGFTWGASVLRW